MNQKETTVPVLIIGGGLVGLSTALFLSQHNIKYKLIERHEGTSIHPKANGFNLRTMELYRNLGITDMLRKEGENLAKSRGWYTAHTLIEANLSHHNMDKPKDPKAKVNDETISPEKFTSCPQTQAEPILLKEAIKREGDLDFYTELIDFNQYNDFVVATVRNRLDGTEEKIVAQYMIAADGIKSSVRKSLDIPIKTKKVYSSIINIYFKANLSEYVKGQEFMGCNITHKNASGTLFPINNYDLWCFHVPYNPEVGENINNYTKERCKKILQTAIGLSNIDINIISILPWIPKERIAKNFQQERIFLVGDAAHEMPPTGGYGANTGIQDAHNLAWKLAMAVKEEAGKSLLNSYEEERQPIAELAIKQSRRIAESGKVFVIKSVNQKPVSIDDHLIATVGYQYVSNAIISEVDNQHTNKNLKLNGKPGTRLPHMWVKYKGKRLSSLDLIGPGFTLILATYNSQWIKAIDKIKELFNVDITVYSISENKDLLVDYEDI